MFERIRSLFKKRGNPRIFTEEEHQRALEVRNQKAEIRRLEQQLIMKDHLETLKALATGKEKGNSTEEAFMNMVLPMILSKINQPQQQPQQQPLNITNTIHSLDQDKINDIVGKVKPYITPQIKQVLTDLTDQEITEIKKRITE